MKRIPLNRILSDAVTTLRRFPLVILVAIIGSISEILVVSSQRYSDPTSNGEFLTFTTTLGVALFFCIDVFCESKKIRILQRAIISAFALVLLTAYFFLIHNSERINDQMVLRHIILMAGLHFCASYAPYTSKGKTNGFWQYNKSLFLRFALAGLYSVVLYIGLVSALGLCSYLFGITYSDHLYFEIWILTVGVFNTWFFLSGVPTDFDSLDANSNYPRGLKIFSLYLLLPLVTIYLVILYFYGAKIAFLGNWPKGQVGLLVSIYSAFTLLTLLLLHPYQFLEAWLTKTVKVFYLAIIPLTFLLFGSIYQRLSDYGITEERYYLLVLNIWLLLTALYFSFSNKRNIKLIPITLSLIALFSSFGPLSAASFTFSSQWNRLEKILKKNNLYENGTPKTTKADISNDDKREIQEVVFYLSHHYGIKSLSSKFSTPLPESPHELIKNFFGFEYNYNYVPTVPRFNYSMDYREDASGKLGSSIYFSDFNYYKKRDAKVSQKINDSAYSIELNQNTQTIELSQSQKNINSVDLKPILTDLKDKSVYNSKIPYKLENQNSKVEMYVLINSIQGEAPKDGTPIITSMHANIIIVEKSLGTQ